VDLLLHAFASLHDVRKTLTLVGPVVEDGLLPRPARADVRVRGKLAREALAAEYASADVLVMPSRGEGYGLVVAEALASGLPAIVSSATGAKDLVRDGENGWVFAAGDAVDLARAMRRACERRPELPRIGQAASETARRCTWERYGEAVRDFYRGLLRP
jgi:glycosyltransferase involved in cell wall biosynthesis